MRLPFWLPWALAAAVQVAPSMARADGDAATAEALFQAGKQLMTAERYPEACPKLAASYRLDPATGTLLALAFCQEKAGQTASAWASYRDAVTRSRRENNPEREQVARERATELEKQLSTLAIAVPPEASSVDGLVVKRDGVVLLEGAWNTPVPVDPGTHAIEASAPGHEPWRTSLTVEGGGKTAEVKIPRLTPVKVVPPPAPSPAPVVVRPVTPEPVAAPTTSPLRTIGIVTGAVGLVGLGLGTGFGVRAIGKNDDSKADCTGNRCGDSGTSARRAALSSADVSTVSFLVGGALVAAGATMIVIGWPSAPGRVRAGVLVTPERSFVSLTMKM